MTAYTASCKLRAPRAPCTGKAIPPPCVLSTTVAQEAQKAPCKGPTTPLRIPAIRTLLRWRRVGSWHPGTFHRQAQSLQGGLCSARAWGIVAKIAEKPCGSGVSSFGTVFGRCCDMLHWHTVRRQAVHGQCSSGRVSIKRAVAPPKICLFSARCEAPARRLSPRCRP